MCIISVTRFVGLISPEYCWKAVYGDELHKQEISQTSSRLFELTVVSLSAFPHRVEEQEL